jgi:hypothetical protein
VGKNLIELALRYGSHFAIAIEQERSRTGGALIEGQNVLQGPSLNSGALAAGLYRRLRAARGYPIYLNKSSLISPR